MQLCECRQCRYICRCNEQKMCKAGDSYTIRDSSTCRQLPSLMRKIKDAFREKSEVRTVLGPSVHQEPGSPTSRSGLQSNSTSSAAQWQWLECTD